MNCGKHWVSQLVAEPKRIETKLTRRAWWIDCSSLMSHYHDSAAGKLCHHFFPSKSTYWSRCNWQHATETKLATAALSCHKANHIHATSIWQPSAPESSTGKWAKTLAWQLEGRCGQVSPAAGYSHTKKEMNIIEGSLEVRLPTYLKMERTDREKVRRQREDKMDKIEEGEVRREFEKVGKSRFTAFFPMICGSGAGQIRDEKIHAVVARSINFQVKSVKRWGIQTTFGRSAVQKVDTD